MGGDTLIHLIEGREQEKEGGRDGISNMKGGVKDPTFCQLQLINIVRKCSSFIFKLMNQIFFNP